MKNIHKYPDHDKEIVLKHIDRDKEREKKIIKINISLHIQNSDISADSL